MRYEGKCDGRNGSSYKTWIDVETISQSSIDNTSTINVKEYVQCVGFSNSAFNLNGNNYCYVNVDGEVRGVNRNIDTRNFALVLLKDENYLIHHHQDGSKTVNIKSGFYISSNTLSSGYIEANYLLKPIKRASQCSLNEFYLHEKIYINTNRTSAEFFHNISLYVANEMILYRNDVAQDITIELTFDERDRILELMPNSSVTQVKIVCETYKDSNLIGTTETYSVCRIDSTYGNYRPSFSPAPSVRYEYKDLGDTPYAPVGIVPGKTKVIVDNADVIASKGTTIKKIGIKMGDKIAEVENVNHVSNLSLLSPNENISGCIVYVIDSRGVKDEISYDFGLSDYYQPSSNSINIVRKNGVEAETYLSFDIHMQDKVKTLYEDVEHTYKVKYKIGENIYDITQSAFDNHFYDGEKQIMSFKNISIHENGVNGGFQIGKEASGTLIFLNGISDFTEFDKFEKEFYVDDGKFLKGSYKDSTGTYHTGYHCLPDKNYEHIFSGATNFEKLYINGNNVLSSYSLYESTGNNGNFEILDDIENYKFTEIYYHTNDYRYSCTKIFNNYKEFETELFSGKMVTYTKWYAKLTDIRISNNQVTVLGTGEFSINTDRLEYIGDNMNYIDKIVGYK